MAMRLMNSTATQGNSTTQVSHGINEMDNLSLSTQFQVEEIYTLKVIERSRVFLSKNQLDQKFIVRELIQSKPFQIYRERINSTLTLTEKHERQQHSKIKSKNCYSEEINNSTYRLLKRVYINPEEYKAHNEAICLSKAGILRTWLIVRIQTGF